MSARGLIARGRKAADRLMFDRCIARVITGETTDPDTAVVTPTYETVYEGRCKIQNQRPWPSTPDAGEHNWSLVPTEVHLPVAGTERVSTGVYLVITESIDPGNVGRQFRVRTDDRKTLQTAIRLLVEEITG